MDSINIEISNEEYRELIHKSATLDMILDAWDSDTHKDHEEFLMEFCKIIIQYYKDVKGVNRAKCMLNSIYGYCVTQIDQGDKS